MSNRTVYVIALHYGWFCHQKSYASETEHHGQRRRPQIRPNGKGAPGGIQELVSEKPVKSVTASDVCRRADISRNAFYLHHASVAGLYAELVNELVDGIRTESLTSVERRTASGGHDDFEAAIVNALARHEDVLRALLPSDDGTLAKRLADGIEDAFVEAALRFGEHGDSLEHRLSCAYSAWALTGFAHRWIAETDRPLTDGMPRFRELHASTSAISVEYLMGQATV